MGVSRICVTVSSKALEDQKFVAVPTHSVPSLVWEGSEQKRFVQPAPHWPSRSPAATLPLPIPIEPEPLQLSVAATVTVSLVVAPGLIVSSIKATDRPSAIETIEEIDSNPESPSATAW